MPRLEITLGKDGGIKVDVIGEEGDHCQEATKFLDELFGKAVEAQLKPEYYTTVLNKDKLLGGGLCG